MKHVFWLRPKLLAGRSGPNLNAWDPRELAAGGIGAVLSVNDASSVYIDDLQRAGLDYAVFPMADNAPPRPGDFAHCLEMLPRAYDYIVGVIEQGRIPLVHCTAGKDRTGLVMCHYLCRREGYEPLEAVAEVRRVRPMALSATDYEEFSVEVLTVLNSS